MSNCQFKNSFFFNEHCYIGFTKIKQFQCQHQIISVEEKCQYLELNHRKQKHLINSTQKGPRRVGITLDRGVHEFTRVAAKPPRQVSSYIYSPTLWNTGNPGELSIYLTTMGTARSTLKSSSWAFPISGLTFWFIFENLSGMNVSFQCQGRYGE